jgi:4'-phosphopantetheinyl transferase
MESWGYIWRRPPERLALEREEVHVWRADLGLTAERIQKLWHTLSPDERERANRFRVQKERIRFIAARGALRDILSRYLGVQPGHVRFQYSAYGKPALGNGLESENLHFNLSHSHGLALYAVARGRAVGIDLEYMQANGTAEQIAERFFSPQEVSVLRALPEAIRTEGFFNCWTRKEAYIKARGEGLSLPLDQFEVSLTPGEPAKFLSMPEAARWSLRALSPAPRYVAALVVEGHRWQIDYWHWPSSCNKIIPHSL